MEKKKITLETSWEDEKLHSKRVEKIGITLETSGEDVHLQVFSSREPLSDDAFDESHVPS